MFHKLSTSKKSQFCFLCIFFGGVLLIMSGCTKKIVQPTPLESLETKKPFSLSVKCENTVIKSGETLDIFCSLKNNSSMAYRINQEIELINFKIDGEVTPYISVAKKNTIMGNSEISRTISIQVNELGTHDITIFSNFDVIDEDDHILNNYCIEVPITVTVE